MKICYVCPDLGIPLDGTKGASAHVRGVIRAFQELGHEVRAVVGITDSDAGLGIPVKVVPRPEVWTGLVLEDAPRIVRALGHLWNNVELEHCLREVCEEFQPDLLYERYSPFGAATGQFAKAHGLNHVLEVNALLAEEGDKYRKQALREASAHLEQVAFRTAGTVITVSESLREGVIRRGGDPDRVTTVPNGVETELFSADGPVAKIGTPDQTVVGFVGSLKPWHGIDRLIECFRTLAAEPHYHFLVVGDGPERKHLNKFAKEIPGRITLTGNVPHEEVPPLLRAIDIAVAPYPALEEFYFSPLKILEYLACGCPVVASAIGQIEDLVDDGRTGILVPPDDDAALLDAIRTLHANPAKRGEMGQAGADTAASEHAWTSRAEEILSLAGPHRVPAPTVKE